MNRGHQLDEIDRLRAENERLREELNEATKSTGGWREYVMRQKADAEAEVERLWALGRAWTDAEDRWFEAANARPYDAEAAARTSLERRAAADNLRNALAEEVTPIQTDP